MMVNQSCEGSCRLYPGSSPMRGRCAHRSSSPGRRSQLGSSRRGGRPPFGRVRHLVVAFNSILDDDAAAAVGWDHGYDFEVIDKFTRSLILSEMRAYGALQD
jgi:hypothetical protein